ncbi:MAG: metallophosphoesterase [Planctomycetota bacterium]|jgi:3',5'-cyclic AMP phosphodiesterase CpdA|nr:metallophosphoesterase [Planctomycetota bacterium]
MAATMIAHISDLHLMRRPSWGQLNLKRFLGYLNYNVSRRIRHRERPVERAIAKLAEYRPDLVIASGDLTQLGTDSELIALRELFMGLKKAGVPVLVAPGNHDCYAGFHPEILFSLRREIALDLRGDDRGVYRLPGVEVAILDQGIPTPPFASYGRTAAKQLAAVSAEWSRPASGASRLVSGHFPVANRRGGAPRGLRGLLDWREVRSFLAACGVSAYLCGHDHKRYRIELDGGCVQYAAPALSLDQRLDIYECDENGIRQKTLL